jgi:hypothetical protein
MSDTRKERTFWEKKTDNDESKKTK